LKVQNEEIHNRPTFPNLREFEIESTEDEEFPYEVESPYEVFETPQYSELSRIFKVN
jgi:hypothetical protein